MTVWVLRPKDDRPWDPWDPWYDKAFGFFIRAETEERARELAGENSGDEIHKNREGDRVYGDDALSVWADPDLTKCVPIDEYGGDDEVLIRDFASA